VIRDYSFLGWIIPGGEITTEQYLKQDEITIVMTRDKEIIALFEEDSE